MKRRHFLAGAATGLALGAGASLVAERSGRYIPPGEGPEALAPELARIEPAAPAIGTGIRELKMVTTWGEGFPGLGAGARRLADRVVALTDGKLRVQVLAGGELVPPEEAFDAVAGGTADLYHGTEALWRRKSPGFAFFASVPGGLTAAEITAWIHHGGGQALWDELSARFNLKALLCGNTGPKMGGWYAREIRSLDDLKGLKLRMPGLGGEVMRRLGATIVTVQGQDIFPALQAGKIDAAAWVGPWNDLAFGFYKIVKAYHWPGFHEPGSAVSLGINRTVWTGLTGEQRAALEHAAASENDYLHAEFNARNGEALAALVDEHGVELRRFPEDVLKAAGPVAAELVAEIGAADATTKRTYESYLAFRRTVGRWTALSDEGYTVVRGAFFPS